MALVPALTLPYTFVNGTIIDAGQVNADFAALTNGLNMNSRTLLTAATTFYVAPGGADVPGNGLAITSPAATIGFILNVLRSSYDLNMQAVTIQLANGTYTQEADHAGDMAGLQGAANLIIQGNMASPNLVTWNGGANACLNCANGALIQVQGVTMQNSAANCIISQTHSRILFQNIIFGPALGAHLVSARGATLNAMGNYTIAGGAQRHVVALEHGEVYLDPEPGNFLSFPVGSPTITLTGTPAFSVSFISSHNLSTVKVGAAFVGAAAAGNQSDTNLNSTIVIYGQGTSYLPGTPATSTNATGGQTQ
jgi:hypothetical protein